VIRSLRPARGRSVFDFAALLPPLTVAWELPLCLSMALPLTVIVLDESEPLVDEAP